MSDEEEKPERVQVLHQCDHHMVVGHKDGRVTSMPVLTEGKPLPMNARLVTFDEVPDNGKKSKKERLKDKVLN